MKFFLIALIIAFSLMQVISAAADSVPPRDWIKNVTMVQQGIDKLFDRFDVDQNGAIDQKDMDAFWAKLPNSTALAADKKRAENTFRQYLAQLDTTNAGNITRAQFQKGFTSVFPHLNLSSDASGVIAKFRELNLCTLVKTVRAGCPLKKSVVAVVKYQYHDLMCRSRAAFLAGAKLEFCVINAADCVGVAKCYGTSLRDGVNIANTTVTKVA